MEVKARVEVARYRAGMENSDLMVDVSTVIPRERHPRVFGAWGSLPSGASMVLVNDHDPVPLFYQFAAEYKGGFRWEYLERGPDLWKVRICKGNFPDPGFNPAHSRPDVSRRADSRGSEPCVLDVRPVLAQGGSPCSLIDQAVAGLAPGQRLVLLAPFEPRPLFGKLRAQGFHHEAKQLADGTWRIEFTPEASTAEAGPRGSVGCCDH